MIYFARCRLLIRTHVLMKSVNFNFNYRTLLVPMFKKLSPVEMLHSTAYITNQMI